MENLCFLIQNYSFLNLCFDDTQLQFLIKKHKYFYGKPREREIAKQATPPVQQAATAPLQAVLCYAGCSGGSIVAYVGRSPQPMFGKPRGAILYERPAQAGCGEAYRGGYVMK